MIVLLLRLANILGCLVLIPVVIGLVASKVGGGVWVALTVSRYVLPVVVVVSAISAASQAAQGDWLFALPGVCVAVTGVFVYAFVRQTQARIRNSL